MEVLFPFEVYFYFVTYHGRYNFIESKIRTAKIAQQVKALADDLSLIPRPHMMEAEN